jgi:hypothetical protein
MFNVDYLWDSGKAPTGLFSNLFETSYLDPEFSLNVPRFSIA